MGSNDATPPKFAAWAGLITLAAAAWWAAPRLGTSKFAPSASVLALVLGVIAGALPGVRERIGAAAKAISKQSIPFAIVLIGFGLDLTALADPAVLGKSLVLVIGAMVVAFAAAIGFGKLCGLDPRAALLLGAGTAVCGNSAILAVAPTVRAEDEDVGLAVGVINLLGVLMILVLPPAVRSLGIDGADGGVLAGLTVHAVPQAIATGEAFGDAAVPWATLYKLLRVAMLVPTVVILALVLGRMRGEKEERGGAGVPLFVILFVVAAGARALGLVDATVEIAGRSQPVWAWCKEVGRFVLAIALAAIGVGIDLGKLVRVGPRFLVAGTLAVGTMVAASIVLVRSLV